MHFYRYNIGDYRKDTGHLSLVEHGIYRALLDTYYSEEQPLCADDAKLMRTHGIRTKDEQEAYKNVINDFFFKTEIGYEHDRCNKELGLIYEKSDKARVSAEKRWEREKQKNAMKSVGENAESMRTHSERIANESKSDANDMLPSNLVTQLPSNQESQKPCTAVVTADAPKKKKEVSPEIKATRSTTWSAYSNAFFNKYGTDPVRNAKVNSAVCRIVENLGDESPMVAEFYLSHNGAWYTQHMHSIEYLAKDAESLRTQWATNRVVTGRKAQEVERLGAGVSSMFDGIDMNQEWGADANQGRSN